VKKLGALLFLLIIGLPACGPPGTADSISASVPASSVEHSGVTDDNGEPVTDVDWEGWTGVYGELRPATDEAVAELRARVAARNAAEWTVHEAVTGTEIAYTPSHVRASWGYLDLHFDPRGDLGDAAVTACLEDGCSEVRSDDDESGIDEALVRRKAPAAFYLLEAQLKSDAELDQILEEGFSTSVATVESPVGPWDCLVHGPEPRHVEALVGTEVVAEEPGRVAKGFASWCVDQRGLVVLDAASSPPIMPRYDSWHSGVDADVTALVPAEGGTDAPVDPTGEYDDVLWVGWEGVYRDVRPATDADVAVVRARVRARNATSWTGALDGMGMTLSVSPEHVRVDAGYAEWHLDPVGAPLRAPYVLCVDGECVRIGPDAKVDGPHVTNNHLDSMTFLLQTLLFAQRQGGAIRLEEPMVSATVESPVGPLDCLVRGDSEQELATLEGTSVSLGLDPEARFAVPLCVDQRGLVTLTSDSWPPAIVYSSWHEGVADDYDTYPGPVRDYNERRED
jgi:hypothetical protein